MHTNPSGQKQPQYKTRGSGLQRFLLIFLFLSLVALLICLLVIGQVWHLPNTPVHQPTPPPVVVRSPNPPPTQSPTHAPTFTPTASLAQRIDTYINHLTIAQQIGQLLMLAVYANGYTAC